MANPAVSLIQRGVYWARYTKGGRPICYAVDSTGEVVKRLRVTRDGLLDAAVQSLWDHLNVVDPVPAKATLKIVRPLPDTRQRSSSEVFDPYDPPPIPWVSRG